MSYKEEDIDYGKWLTRGLITVCLVVIWFNIKTFVSDVKNGFTSINEKMDKMVEQLSDNKISNAVQDEKILFLQIQDKEFDKRIDKLEKFHD